MSGAFIGGIVGFFIAHIIAASKSKFTYLGGGYGRVEGGMGCFKYLLFSLAFIAMGALCGGIFLR